MNRFRRALLLPRVWNYYRPTHWATWVASRDASASKKWYNYSFVNSKHKAGILHFHPIISFVIIWMVAILINAVAQTQAAKNWQKVTKSMWTKIWRLLSSFYRYFQQFLLLQQYGDKNNGYIFLKWNNLSFPNSFNIYRSKSVEGVFYKFDIVSIPKYGHKWNVQINPEWSKETEHFGTSEPCIYYFVLF